MTTTKVMALLVGLATVGLARGEIFDPEGTPYNGTENWNLELVPFGPLNLTADDAVVFKYIKNAHFALLTTSPDCTGGEQLPYAPCGEVPVDPGQPRLKYRCAVFNASAYDDGVPRWVYCNVTGHCQAGMNIQLTVEANSSANETGGGEYEGGGVIPLPPVSGSNITSQPLFFALHDGEGCNSSTVDAYTVSGVLTGLCNRLSSNQSTIATCETISVYDDDNCQGEANTTALSDFCGGPALRNATITCVENATYVRIDFYDTNDTTCTESALGTEYAIADTCMVSDAGQYFTMTNVTNETLTLSIFPPWNCIGEANETGTIPLHTCIYDNLTARNYVFSWADPRNLTVFTSSASNIAGGAKIAQLLAVFLLGVVVSFAV